MGSSLSEQERIGLEDVFLSISSSGTLTQKWSHWKKNLLHNLNTKIILSPFHMSKSSHKWIQKSLKTDKIANLLPKIGKRRKF